jgi:uncharacterized membrane protein
MLLALLPAPFFSLAATALPVRLALGLHIAAGATALLAGLVPMLGRKGGKTHVRAGRLYVYCMITVAATAVLLCLLQPLTIGRLLLTGVAVLSFYLSFSGWRAARRRSTTLATGDAVLAAVSSVVGLLMLAAGVWLQAVLFAFFGVLISLFAGLDTVRSWHPKPAATPTPWLFRHFTRMGGAYIATFTAFVVVNLGRWLPSGAPQWSGLVGWMAPTVVGTIIITRTVRKYKHRLRPATAPVTHAAGVVPLVLLLTLASLPTRLAVAQAAAPRLLKGLITDSAGQPLAYATAGVVGKGVGTVADEHGRFGLSLPASVAATDSLRFALLGYASRTWQVAALPTAPLTVVLPAASINLPNVAVRARGLDSARIGNRHYRTNLQTNFALGSQPSLNVGSEIGRVFQMPQRGTWLERFDFVLCANDFDTVQLRINVYQLCHGEPGTSLLQQPIYKQIVGQGPRRVQVDFHAANLNLFVNDDAVAVTVEWVGHSRQGRQLALPLLLPAFATHLYRYGAANNWKSFPSMSTAMELRVRY